MDELFRTILNMAVSAGWLVLAVCILRLVLRRAPRSLTCALWALVGLRLVLPFSVGSVLSLLPSRETLTRTALYASHPRLTSGIDVLDRAAEPVMASLAPSVSDSVNPLQVALTVGAWVWLAGAAVMLLCAMVSFLRLRRRVRTAVRGEDGLWQCETVASPFLLGVLRPRIYVPFSLPESEKADVTAHERMHIRRGDQVWKFLGWLLLSVYWFQPLLWLAWVLLCRDIESACDERVVREMDTQGRKRYAQTLLSCSAGHGAAICPLAFGEVNVKSRIRSVLNYRRPALWLTVLAVLLGIAAAVCFLTDPVEKQDLSFLNYENAGAVAMQTEELEVVWYPADGGIRIGAADGSEAALLLSRASWKKMNRALSLPSPGSVELRLDESLCITVYESLRRAVVRCGEEERWYRTGKDDYAGVLAILHNGREQGYSSDEMHYGVCAECGSWLAAEYDWNDPTPIAGVTLPEGADGAYRQTGTVRQTCPTCGRQLSHAVSRVVYTGQIADPPVTIPKDATVYSR